LPHGGMPRPDCGNLVHVAHSAGAVLHRVVSRHDCRRHECPICPGWALREADRITRRIEAAMEDHDWLPAHWVVSPPPELWPQVGTVKGYRRLRTKAYAVARDRGIRGAAVVFHHMHLDSDRWGGGGCPSEGPHWHFLGDGWLDLQRVVDGQARDGWVVKGLGVRKSVRETALYLLSHASMAERPERPQEPEDPGNPAVAQPTHRARSPFAVVTWMGSLAYNRLRVTTETTDGRFCPICKEMVPAKDWMLLCWVGQGPPPMEGGVSQWYDWRAVTHDAGWM
jgi:hypothetical protein